MLPAAAAVLAANTAKDFIKEHWKSIAIIVLIVMVLGGTYRFGYINGRDAVLQQAQDDKEAAEKAYNELAGKQELTLSELRTANEQQERKAHNETEKDIICSDKPMPVTRVQSLTKRTSSR